jgi:esterase/lipase superfamily enzyme
LPDTPLLWFWLLSFEEDLMPNVDHAVTWFKQQFAPTIQAHLGGTPFTLDFITAIAIEETFHIWGELYQKLPVGEVLKLCVDETIDAPARQAFPRNKGALLAAPNGQQMFTIARQALVSAAKHIPSYKVAARNPNKFCRRFGIFGYDLKFFKSDPDFFLDQKWISFDQCIVKCIRELTVAQRRAPVPDKGSLTDKELVLTAVAYSTGKVSPSKCFKQGFKDTNGKYFGERIRDNMQLAKSILPTLESNPPTLESSPETARVARRAARDDAEYMVWYGTNRKPIDPSDASKGYSARRDKQLHLGTCHVFIPKSHKIGSLGSPWWKRLLTRKDDRLKLLTINEMVSATYWQSLVSHFASIPMDDRDALIFVHGYNVSFENAALRAAQIGFDLSVRGALAFFSWPSRGQLSDYTSDEATIEASEPWITEFIEHFGSRSGANRIHMIAHSMGNRGVLRAVERIAATAQERTKVPFGQIILAAADVDADTFRNLSAAYSNVSQRTTLYVSSRDRAVEASEWLHDFPRAGLLPPILAVPGIDTVNVTNANLTMLGHGYVAEARGVLEDMHALIRHGAPPERRFGLREDRTPNNERFWLIGL